MKTKYLVQVVLYEVFYDDSDANCEEPDHQNILAVDNLKAQATGEDFETADEAWAFYRSVAAGE